MATIHAPQPQRDQPCPVCGTKLPVGALYCESCGTDLSRAGALFSTEVKPITTPVRKRSRLRPIPRRARVALITAGAMAVLLTVSTIPALARLPVLGAIGQTVLRGVDWGRALLGVPRQQQVQAEELSLLVIRSDPPGAQVYVDDQHLGKTPMSTDVRPGTYEVTLAWTGYPPVSRTVEVRDGPIVVSVAFGETAPSPAPAAPASPRPAAPTPPTARPPQAAPKPKPAPARVPLAVGTRAPDFLLKNRFGVIFRLQTYRGRDVAVLFVWTISDSTEATIREFDARIRRAGNQTAGLVIVLRDDRRAVRNLIETWGIRVPILFGTPEVIRAYGIPDGRNALFLVSERGVIERRQVGTIKPSIIPLPRK